MEIRSQSSDHGFAERPLADITRLNREAIQRTTADHDKKVRKSAAEVPKTDPEGDSKGDIEKRLKNAREAAREKFTQRIHRAREQARDELTHRIHRARQQARDELTQRLHNARAKAAAEPQIQIDPQKLGGMGARAAEIVHDAGDGLDISQAARTLIEHAQGDDKSRMDAHDSERAARLADVKSRLDRGELNTDELIAQTAVRILAGENGA